VSRAIVLSSTAAWREANKSGIEVPESEPLAELSGEMAAFFWG